MNLTARKRLWNLPLSASGNQLKVSPLVEPVGGKSAAIQCEHEIGAQFFPESNQRRIGIVHRDVTVLFHQDRNPLEACLRRGNHQESPSQQELKTNLLRLPARTNQMKRLGEDRFGRNDPSAPVLE